MSEYGRWDGRPVAAFLVRCFVVLVPIAAAVGASAWYEATRPHPRSLSQTFWTVVGSGDLSPTSGPAAPLQDGGFDLDPADVSATVERML